jgi:Tol biopolymer transport system component
MDRPFPAYNGDDPYIFVSYAHDDSDTVYPEIGWLKDQGFNLWYDEGIGPGQEWHQELADRIDGSSLFLYFITPQSAASAHCQREAHYAIDNDMQLLAVHLEDTTLPSGVNLSLGNIQAIMRYELSELDYRIKLLKGAGDYLERSIGVASVPSPKGAAFSSLPVVTGIIIALLAGATIWGVWTGNQGSTTTTPGREIRRLTLEVPMGPRPFTGLGANVVLSQDGSTLVYVGGNREYYYSLAQDQGMFIETDAFTGGYVALSPDGEWLVFDDAFGSVRKVAATGGSSILLGEAEGATLATYAWGPKGKIAFITRDGRELYQIDENGGKPALVKTAESARIFKHLTYLPDGSGLVVTIGKQDNRPVESDVIAVVSFGAAKLSELQNGASAHVTADGYIIFYRNNALWASVFDVAQLRVQGESVGIVENVAYHGRALYGFANDGTLVYVPRVSDTNRHLVWVDRQGKEQKLALPPGTYHSPAVSPDGTRLAVISSTEHNEHLWTYGLNSEQSSQLTFGSHWDASPAWYPDSKRLLHVSATSATRSDGGEQESVIYERNIDGTGTPREILSRQKLPFWPAISADGKHLLFGEWGATTGWKLMMGTLGDSPVVTELPVPENRAILPSFSPDGRWLAYVAGADDAPGIFVRPFPNVMAGIWKLAGVGTEPRWNPNSNELFFRQAGSLMAVAVQTHDGFQFKTRQNLFDITGYSRRPREPNYAVSSDGRRFLMIKEDVVGKIKVVLNLNAELARLLPRE